MISIFNYKKRLYQENISFTDYIDQQYSNEKENIIKLDSEFNFSDTSNLNKTFFQRNCEQKDNIVCLPLGISQESNYNIQEIISKNFEKSTLCSCQVSNITRLESDINSFSNFDFVEYFPIQNNKIFLENIAKSKYVLCPWGTNPDTFRLWESLYLSAIPVTIKHSKLNSFSELPILFLDSWEQLTKELLENEYDGLINKSREKLELDYWIDKMRN